MSDILDYLQWRGDLTFDKSPFNEVDNLILSQLAYVNYDGIVPGPSYDEQITLEEACDLFYKMHTEKEVAADKSFIRLAPVLLKHAAATERFKHIGLYNYVSKLDYKEEKQFSALHYQLDDETIYVAYRGTDDTILGWKEDFNMTFLAAVPSQIEAARYLNATLKCPPKNVYIGGHSKGGNLAIYAATQCDPKIKPYIVEIFNNDGPGFDEHMLESTLYQEMLSRITTIIPQSSVIGMLLEHEEAYKVIKSKQLGIMQHDAMSWEVLGNSFVTCDTVSKGSQILDHTLKSWLRTISKEEREQFTDALYEILETTGAKTLSDLSTSRLKKINKLLKSYNALDEATKAKLTQMVSQLASTYYQMFKESILSKPSAAKPKGSTTNNN